MMMNNSRRGSQGSLAEINITPFVDVVLVLLIIFMLTAPILESGIVMETPKTKTVRAISQERVVVTIDKDKNYFVGNDMVNIHLLGQTVRNRSHGAVNRPVYIRCVENVNFGTFVEVVDALKQGGLTNLNIVTEPLETRSSAQ